ncbi:hypothetical protein HZC35_01020 [Candidatus Saganbacteria bacterium]|nr:hypothetical protein [Candidatus Saganbacteria bacterium]
MAEKEINKDQLQILLEDIKGKVKQVAEGHSTILSRIDNMEKNLKSEISIVNLAVNVLGKRMGTLEDQNGRIEEKVDKIDNKLEDHIKYHPGTIGQISQPVNP